jgi:serine/threonine-protein kinase
LVDTSLELGVLASTDSFVQPLGQLGSYRLLAELGRGGFGIVWEAEHVEQRYRVALKTLPSDLQDRLETHRAADRLHRFRQEFRRLHDVNHPNLVGMQNLECDGLQWYFTMELVKGVDFFSYVRPSSVLDVSRLYHAFAQLVARAAELHQRRIVHLVIPDRLIAFR